MERRLKRQTIAVSGGRMNVHPAFHISKAVMVRGMIGNFRCSYGGNETSSSQCKRTSKRRLNSAHAFPAKGVAFPMLITAY
jgi:hypothetical protein